MKLDWLNGLLIAFFSLGHGALVIAVVNRLHARRLPYAVLHPIRLVHDFVIALLPLAFVWRYGGGESGLLFGGLWHTLPLPLLAYLAVCGVIAGALPIIAIRRAFAKPPEALIANHSTKRDIAAELGFRPICPGPYHIMTRVPGNEILQLDVSEKALRLPRLPQAWDGLSILHISDLHFIGTIGLPYFERVIEIGREMKSDLIVFTGDLLDREELISWLPSTLGRLNAPLGCYFVLGNHDWYLSNVPDIRRQMEELGWRDVSSRCLSIEHRDETLVVGGSETPWMGTNPNFSETPPGAFRLFLSHTPDNFPWARRNHVDLMLSGHNHGGQIRLPGFGPVYSPSVFGCRYASGVFWGEPTLLHVSRGISGRHPLRWNCPPELTRVVLRAGS